MSVNIKSYLEPLILIAAIILGALSGVVFSVQPSLVDYSIIAMLCCLFFNVSLTHLLQGVKNKKYLTTAWLFNFVLLPTIAFLISSLFVNNDSMIFVGLIFYLVAPCTDWFLGFTKLANGNLDVNLALLPINLMSQILLLPLYLLLFTKSNTPVPLDSFLSIFLNWILLPFLFAQLLRFVCSNINDIIFEKSSVISERGMFVSLTILIFAIFNGNIYSLLKNLSILPTTLIVVALFFLSVYFIGLFISKKVGFTQAETSSLIITASARNTPLMLAISVGVFPSETVIQLILILGMLIEFPHLIVLSFLLRK